MIAYALDDGSYRVIDSVECGKNSDPAKIRIPPFETVEIDLGYVFGEELNR